MPRASSRCMGTVLPASFRSLRWLLRWFTPAKPALARARTTYLPETTGKPGAHAGMSIGAMAPRNRVSINPSRLLISPLVVCGPGAT